VRQRPALTTLNTIPYHTPAGCRMPAHNRPNIRVSSPRTAKSRSRKARVRQSWSTLLRRVSRWRGARLVRRTMTAAPRAVRIVCVAALVLAAFSLTNLVYHVVSKPSELLFFVGGALDKEPIETWRRYEPLFRTYSTSTITPELLAALAQVESTGNPVARTYWRWQLTWNPFAVYKPASSAVGMYQMTDAAYAEAARYCIVGRKEKTHLTDLQHPWRRIRKAAGLGDARIHDLRHTFASGGLLVGEGLAMIGKLLGHTQVQTTARYAHLASDPVKQAATKISDRLALSLLGAIDKPSAKKAKQLKISMDEEADDAAAA